jgi:hypothetical protein
MPLSPYQRNNVMNRVNSVTGGIVDIYRMIFKGNIPNHLAEKFWAINAPVLPFGNYPQHVAFQLASDMDMIEMDQFTKMTREERAEYDESEMRQVQMIKKVLISMGQGDTLSRMGNATQPQDQPQQKPPVDYGAMMVGKEGLDLNPDSISGKWRGHN